MSEQYRHPKKRGLTLIEVLLALIILSLSLSAMMLAMGRCLSVIRTARNRDTARSLLQRIHVDHPIEKIDYRTLIETGDFDEVDTHTWTREIIPENEENLPGLFLVRHRVEWSERNRLQAEEAEFFVYAPEAESITSQFVP